MRYSIRHFGLRPNRLSRIDDHHSTGVLPFISGQ
jgi:hypothetical protein